MIRRLVWGTALGLTAMAAILRGGWPLIIAIELVFLLGCLELTTLILVQPPGKSLTGDWPMLIIWGSSCGFVFYLRAVSPWLALWPIMIAVGYDTGAFLAGRTWGKTIVCATLSPKKSWEGTLFGFLLGAWVGELWWVGCLQPIVDRQIVLWILVASLPATAIGDFMASWLKRKAVVKDSSDLITNWLASRGCKWRWEIPGHGGIIDRCLSIAHTILVVSWFVSLNLTKTA